MKTFMMKISANLYFMSQVSGGRSTFRGSACDACTASGRSRWKRTTLTISL